VHRLSAVAAALALAPALAGCAAQHRAATPNVVHTPSGASLFAGAGCGGCHTLAAAGSSGTRGPNLDQLKPDAARVQKQVENGGAAMPAFKGTLSDSDIANVAAYVASAAGQ
jgi:cytochrome c6